MQSSPIPKKVKTKKHTDVEKSSGILYEGEICQQYTSMEKTKTRETTYHSTHALDILLWLLSFTIHNNNEKSSGILYEGDICQTIYIHGKNKDSRDNLS